MTFQSLSFRDWRSFAPLQKPRLFKAYFHVVKESYTHLIQYSLMFQHSQCCTTIALHLIILKTDLFKLNFYNPLAVFAILNNLTHAFMKDLLLLK